MAISGFGTALGTKMQNSEKFRDGPFLRTPEQIRAQSALLRASPDQEARKLAKLGEALAMAVEKRQHSEMPDLETLHRKLADARREVRNLIVIGLRPDLSPEKAETIRNLERSARAEVKLRIKALEYAKAKQLK